MEQEGIKLSDVVAEGYSAPPTDTKIDKPPDESTWGNYFDSFNPISITYSNKNLRYNANIDLKTHLDTTSPEFLELYNKADDETKDEMLKATSVSHAEKIYERRQIQEDALSRIEQDPFLTKLGMGAVAGITSPTTILTLPITGALGSAFKISSMASRVLNVGRVAAASGLSGATIGLSDAALADAQGEKPFYLAQSLGGLVVGGGLGIFAGALATSGTKYNMAKALSSEGDDLTQALEKDPTIIMTDVDGEPMITGMKDIAPMKKNFIDRIPVVGKILKSDITTLYQSQSKTVRAEASRIATATDSLVDAEGKPIVQTYNMEDFKQKMNGVLNTTNQKVEESFNIAKSKGFKGDIDDFVKEVSNIYTKAAVKQEKQVYIETTPLIKELKNSSKTELKNKLKKLKEEDLAYYKDSDGKHQPVTQEMLDSGEKLPDIIAKKRTKKEYNTLKKEIEKEYNAKLEQDIQKIMDDTYEKYQPRFEGSEAHISAAEHYREYYKHMLEVSKKIGVEELKNTSMGRLYRPRTWNFKYVNDGTIPLTEVKSRIYKALANHPNQAGMTAEELSKAADLVVEHLRHSSFSLDFMSTSFVSPKTLPFKGVLKNRKLKLDDTFLGPLLRNDLSELTGAYHYKMTGRQAIQKAYGTTDIGKITAEMRDKIFKAGETVTSEEMQALDRALQDTVGTLRMNTLSDTPAWRFTRGLSIYNSLRLGGGFAGNQVIELAGGLMKMGIMNVFNGRVGKTLENSAKLLFTKNKIGDEVAQAILASGHMETSLYIHRINRYADGEAGFNGSWLENKLNKLNDKYMKWNGMRYLTSTMEDLAGGSAITEIQKLGSKDKLTKAEVGRLSRWGLSVEDTKSLYRDLSKYYKPKEGKLSLEKFSQNNRDKLQNAISRAIRETVVQGNSIHTPSWMKTATPVIRLMSQFMRFPLTANEVLLRKGLSSEKAKFGASIMSSVTVGMSLYYLREQAAVHLGLKDKYDTKYNYFGQDKDEAMQRGLLSSLNYVASLGMMTNVFNTGANIFGATELGRTYAGGSVIDNIAGPSGGILNDISKISKDVSSGEGLTARDYRRLKMYVPYNNLPLIDEAVKKSIEVYK